MLADTYRNRNVLMFVDTCEPYRHRHRVTFTKSLQKPDQPWNYQVRVGERLRRKFAGQEHAGSDRRHSSNRGSATQSVLRSVTLGLDIKNPNEKCHIFVTELCSYRSHAFWAMPNLVVIVFFCPKLSLKSLQHLFPKMKTHSRAFCSVKKKMQTQH